MLVYDWSQEGDVEVVIEDIENTELDMIECYSNQQKDWRFGDEINAATARYQCTNRYWVRKKLNCFGLERATFSNILIPPMEQLIEMEEIFRHVSSERFAPGANQHLGDDVLMMKLFGIHNSYKSLNIIMRLFIISFCISELNVSINFFSLLILCEYCSARLKLPVFKIENLPFILPPTKK